MKYLIYFSFFLVLNAVLGQRFEYPFTYPEQEHIEQKYEIDENGDSIEIVEFLPIQTQKNIPLYNFVDTIQECYKNSVKQGVKLTSIGFSECEGGSDPHLTFNPRISDVYRENGMVKYSVNIEANCGLLPGGFVTFSSDTLKFYYGHFDNSWAMCDCCFTLDYYLKTERKFNHFLLNDEIIEISSDKYKIIPPRKVEWKGDSIGVTGKYGARDGWYHFKHDSIIISRLYDHGRYTDEIWKTFDGKFIKEHCFLSEDGLIDNLYLYNKKGKLIQWEERLMESEKIDENRFRLYDVLKIYYPNGQLKYFKKSNGRDEVIEEKHFKKNGKLKK